MAGDRGDNGIVGLLGVDFEYPDEDILGDHKYQNDRNQTQYQPIYNLKNGTLRVLSLTSTSDENLQTLANDLIRFAMLLGGFGKSWRRIDHRLFYKSYTKSKPTIGCHWQFARGSESFYLPINTLEDVGKFIDRVCQNLQTWASGQINLGNTKASDWREAWHRYNNRSGVEVWGRMTEDDRSFYEGVLERIVDKWKTRNGFPRKGDRFHKRDFIDNIVNQSKLNKTKTTWNNTRNILQSFNFWCSHRNSLIHGAQGISKQRLKEVWEQRNQSNDANACRSDKILENMEAILRNDLKLLKQEEFQKFVGEDADYYIYSAVRSYAIEQLEQFEKSSN